MGNGPLISLTDVSLIRDNKEILRDININVNRGDFVAITGPNGGGKTTLLRIILGLIKPSGGQVKFPCGRPATGYLPQKNAIDSQFPVTVKEVVASGLLGVDSLSKTEVERLTLEVLREIELEDFANKPIGRLSGGQMQRTLLGRAIVASPSLLVLDEPLSYLDKHFEQRTYEILARLAGKTTIILVSHDMSTIDSMANRHFIVNRTLKTEISEE